MFLQDEEAEHSVQIVLHALDVVVKVAGRDEDQPRLLLALRPGDKGNAAQLIYRIQ